MLRALFIAIGVAVMPLTALSQSAYPTKSIRVIVPYAPGGLPDSVARLITPALSERLGQQVVVDNRPGAGGVAAAQALAQAPADGYTLILSDAAMLSLTPLMQKKLPYDPEKDFIPVSLIARAPNFFAVNSSLPVNTMDEFILLAKSKPGTLNCGSSGNGSLHHLTLEAMKLGLGIDVVHVPFKGSGQSVPALIGGQVDCVFAALPSLAGFVKAGRVKLLSMASTKRSPLAPDVPALGSKIPGFDYAFLIGVLAPKGTPSNVVKRLSSEIAAVAKNPDVIKKFETIGVESAGGDSQEYGRSLREDAQRVESAVRSAKLKFE